MQTKSLSNTLISTKFGGLGNFVDAAISCLTYLRYTKKNSW